MSIANCIDEYCSLMKLHSPLTTSTTIATLIGGHTKILMPLWKVFNITSLPMSGVVSSMMRWLIPLS